MTPKLYSYVVVFDAGFAPNPFWGWCTLAACKPRIRRKAQLGDWIIGTGSKKNVGNDKLIYAMKVTRSPIPIEVYGSSEEFKQKVPDLRSKDPQKRCGDNIYYRDANGHIRQRPSFHSNGFNEDPSKKSRDLSGQNVLVSDHFYYFGRNAIDIPGELREIVKNGPGYKVNFPSHLVRRFLEWLEHESGYSPGVHGLPYEHQV